MLGFHPLSSSPLAGQRGAVQQLRTLEELDKWGTLDQLDQFGTLEQLDFLEFKDVSGSAALSLSATAVGSTTVTHEAQGSASISIAASSECKAVIPIVGVQSDIALASSGVATHLKSVSGQAAISFASSGEVKAVLSFAGASAISSSASASFVGTFVQVSTTPIEISSLAVGERLGEAWSDISTGSETWSDLAASSIAFSQQSVGSESWLNQ